jgi:hypothetical protein
LRHVRTAVRELLAVVVYEMKHSTVRTFS